MPEKIIPNITLEELKKHNGKEGKPCYVAVNGDVYEVSGSSMWEDGCHQDEHSAGCDLTEAFSQAPHGMEVFESFNKAGVLASAQAAAKTVPRKKPPTWASKLISLHSHPIASHFPQAFFVFAPAFLVLFYITGVKCLERTAYYLLWAGLLMAFPATVTGFIHWRYKYAGRSKPIFRLKMILSILLLLAGGLGCAVHAAFGVLSAEAINWPTLLLHLAAIPLAVMLGRAGGQIVFGGKGK